VPCSGGSSIFKRGMLIERRGANCSMAIAHGHRPAGGYTAPCLERGRLPPHPPTQKQPLLSCCMLLCYTYSTKTVKTRTAVFYQVDLKAIEACFSAPMVHNSQHCHTYTLLFIVILNCQLQHEQDGVIFQMLSGTSPVIQIIITMLLIVNRHGQYGKLIGLVLNVKRLNQGGSRAYSRSIALLAK